MEPPRVRFTAANNLRSLAFDDGAVVLDPLSWDVHVLNPSALAVLELLVDAPRTLSDIAAFLNNALEPTEQTEAPAHAERLICELQFLGLVHRIDVIPSAIR